ncbi:MAG: AMP-binding acetyl-CoA synthetase [Nevskiaceae bacterium]|nr:MAG: AMP-binding acetyl-CoA synthetase [Nevskiaceae bacterium]
MKTQRQQPTLLHSLLYWEAHRTREVYLTQPFPDGRVVDYTWVEVAGQARRMAAHLRSLGLPPGSRIAILGKNSAHWIMADLAIWMAGHVSVPLYPALNGETAAYVLGHSGASLLFLGKMDGKGDGWNDIAPVLPPSLPLIALPMAPRDDLPRWDDIIARTQPLQDVSLPQPGDLATILYTSGSTGRPKGVMHAHGSFVRAAQGLSDLLGSSSADRMLSYLPLAHVAERAAVQGGSLYYGYRVFFADRLETFPDDLRRARPTIFFSVPRLWTKFYLGVNQKLPLAKQKKLFAIPLLSRLVKKKILTQLGLQDTRIAITGSAPLPPELLAWYRKLGLELLEFYGMTENLAYSHGGHPGRLREGWIGHGYRGVEARIDGNGELLVKSPCQMLGYYQAPEATAEATTADGFFRTGDRGAFDDDGRLRITGRVKELFKTSKGKYVAPAPIENRLGSHPAVESVCVTGPSQPQPFALLMLSPEAQQARAGQGGEPAVAQALENLLRQVNGELEDHEKLDYLVVVKEPWTVENGFLTPTLKIKRNVIEERYLPEADRWAGLGRKIVWH